MSRAYLSWAQASLPDPLVVTGQGAASAAGSPAPGIVAALAGQSASSAFGGLGLTAIQRAYLSWTQLGLPPFTGVNQALIGQSAAAASGTMVGGAARGFLSWSMLALPPSSSIILAGQTATTANGTLSAVQGATQALTGQSAAVSAGTLTQGKMSVLNGSAMTISAGTLAASDETIAFSGVLSPQISVALPSQTMAAAQGGLTVISDGVTLMPLVGRGMASSSGVLGPQFVAQVFGYGAQTVSGQLLFSGPNVLAGQVGASALGTIAATNSITLTGQSAGCSSGAFFVGQILLTGQVMNAQAGAVAPPSSWTNVGGPSSIWTDITPANSSWTNVNN